MAKKDNLQRHAPLDTDVFIRMVRELRKDGVYFWELFARVLFSLAMRICDARTLTWRPPLSRPECVVTEKKTGKNRAIILSDAVQEKFREIYTLMGEPDMDSMLFLNPRTGRRTYTSRYFNEHLKPLRTKYDLDITKFSTHPFRKSFGKWYYEANGCIERTLLNLMRMFGHSSILMTMKYIGLTQEEIIDAYMNVPV